MLATLVPLLLLLNSTLVLCTIRPRFCRRKPLISFSNFGMKAQSEGLYGCITVLTLDPDMVQQIPPAYFRLDKAGLKDYHYHLYC